MKPQLKEQSRKGKKSHQKRKNTVMASKKIQAMTNFELL